MAKLKVYKVNFISGYLGNGRQQCVLLIATTSFDKAAKIMGITPHYLKRYGNCIANEKWCNKALSKPETAFIKELNDLEDNWIEYVNKYSFNKG